MAALVVVSVVKLPRLFHTGILGLSVNKNADLS